MDLTIRELSELATSRLDVADFSTGGMLEIHYGVAFKFQREAVLRLIELGGDREPTISIMLEAAARFAFNAERYYSALEMVDLAFSRGFDKVSDSEILSFRLLRYDILKVIR